ncbi:hypothetical protein FY036_06525 [Mesorhizobium microcysteis]|uniref:Uncharacterized protein n=1 Tax=Neoaquamicrobium microcysteis TaxID=2682781 RepID=A0A5D4GZH4_9HYPH|nr:hypothetical protein [Mesorhizobium microcysteis]TYR33707.1 hypothetical protein FY036_06525 [Mesorhizobium microcysteis]
MNALTRTAKFMNVDWSLQPRNDEEGRWIAAVVDAIPKESLRHPATQFLIPIILSVIDGYLCGHSVLVDGLPTHIEDPSVDDRDAVLSALSAVKLIKANEANGEGYYDPCQRLTDTLGKPKSVLLNHSRPLGLHTWSDYPAVDALTDTIYADHFGPKQSTVRRKLLRLVLLELYLAWTTDPTLKLTVSRNNNDYPRDRYNGMGITKTIIDVINILRDAGLIRQAIGFNDRLSSKGYISRIWPTGKLTAMFGQAGFEPEDIDTHHRQETIVLNRPSSKPKVNERIDYDDTEETHRMRALLGEYNSLLARTDIGIPSRDTNPHDKFVYRVFNRGSFEMGGRFYGGWWQDCSKAERALITIDAEETIELDFPGMLPTLLYAEAGIDYWSEVGSDPYTLVDPPASVASIATREFCKTLFHAAVNAENETSALRSVLGKGQKLTHLRQILDLLKEKHRPIADSFGTGCGHEMMNKESKIAERIIEHFTQKGIPVLTVHDSYIVAWGYRHGLQEVMGIALETIR